MRSVVVMWGFQSDTDNTETYTIIHVAAAMFVAYADNVRHDVISRHSRELAAYTPEGPAPSTCSGEDGVVLARNGMMGANPECNYLPILLM